MGFAAYAVQKLLHNLCLVLRAVDPAEEHLIAEPTELGMAQVSRLGLDVLCQLHLQCRNQNSHNADL